jgi:RNA polymerase sigma-70 factor (ECF subfamily)
MTADAAVAELFRRYGDDVFGLGLRLCARRSDAEDLVQETFLRAYRDWSSYRGESTPATWLYTIAVRSCRRLYRRRRGEPERVESLGRTYAGRDESDEMATPQGGPLDTLIRDETRDTVQRALGRLPLHYRLPLALKELTDFSVEEIASLLELKPGTVRSRVHRARLQLAREIQAGNGIDDDSRCAPICRDLLEVKQRALDNGKSFDLPPRSHCERCRSLHEGLEISQRACRDVARAQLPASVRRLLWREISPDAQAHPDAPGNT